MIKGYNEFINEEFLFNNSKNDIAKFIANLIENDVPTDEIMEFKHDLDNILTVNESISEDFNKIKFKYGKWMNDKLFKWLIKRKQDFYTNLADKLSSFDLTTLDDVYENFPGFKIESLYLAGGMDEAADTGKGEYEFEKNHSKKQSDLPEIEIYDDKFNPNYVVDGIYLDKFLENPKNTLKMYSKPALLNPVRKEVDRTKDDTFDNMVGDLKKPNYDPIENPKPFAWFRDTFSKTIEPDDEHLLRISDAVFLGQDATAGAGTYGELELLSLMRKPLFAWLVNESSNRAGAFKLWNIPHLCKVARTEEDMEQLVKTIVKNTK